MNTTYQYTSMARWTTGRSGIMNAQSVDEPLVFSAPPEFQGQSALWTPEHFLVAAVAGCFITTFIAIAEASKFEPVALEVTAVGSLEKVEHGFQFTRIVVRPALTITRESDRDRAIRLLEKAERACLVSRSLRSEVVMEPQVFAQVQPSAA